MVLRNLIQNLDSEDYDIHLLALYKIDKEFIKPIIDKVTVVKGVGFYFRGLDKLLSALPARLLYKIFIKNKYDYEISFQFGLPTKCLSASNNDKRLCWMHTYDTEMIQRKYYIKYPKIITVSKIGCDKLVGDGFPISQCDYCYNIIDETEIIEKSMEPIDVKKDYKYVVVTVARMMPDKAFMRYVECIKKLLDDTEVNAEFWLIGGGPDQAKIMSYVSNNKLERHIKVLGVKKNPYSYIASSNLYFCASFREGFSTSCQEAAILGIPVVSVNVDGANELIEQTQSGCVIENNSEAIISTLKYVFSDDKIIENWKRSAEKTKQLFYKNRRIDNFERIINNLDQ